MIKALKKSLSCIFPKRKLRVLMVGMPASGKTRILYKMNRIDLVPLIPTIGFNIETFKYSNYDIDVMDLGGECKIIDFWPLYLQSSQGIIYVIDSNHPYTFEDSINGFHKIYEILEQMNIPILVFANKKDLPNVIKPAEMVKKLQLDKIRNPWHIQETCAITGEGLDEGFAWLAEQMCSKL